MNKESNICRTCLSEREVMYSLFARVKLKSVQDPLLDFVKMLSSISIQVSETDNLPKRICQQCSKMVNIAYIFQQQCKEADLWLHEHFEKDFLQSSVVDGNTNEAQNQDLEVTENPGDIAQGANELSHIKETSEMIEEVLSSSQQSETCNIKVGVNSSSKTSSVPKLPYKTHKYFSFERVQPRSRVLKLPEGFEMCENDNRQKWYKCKECVKIFSSVTECHAHKRCHKLYVCKICRRTFRSQHGLSYHKKQHLGLKKYVCTHENCNKRFVVKQALDRHKTQHSEEKNHLCNFCGKSYNTADSLRYHLKMHGGERPHLCMYCGRTFTQAGHLTYHMLSHTGAKPHVCNICGRCYTAANQLKKHSLKYCSVGKVPRFRPKLRDALIAKQDALKNEVSDTAVDV